MLHRLVESIQPYAASLGGPGLVLIAFLDSSFLTFPEVPDFLLAWLVVQHPVRRDHANGAYLIDDEQSSRAVR